MNFQPTPLDRSQAVVNPDGTPTFFFQRAWDDVQEGIVNYFLSIPGVLEAITEAQAAADAANAAAENADNAATQAAADSSLASSGITPDNVLSATDAGASATINVAAHSRVYGNGDTVSVNLGSITGLTHSTTYYVIYDQASRAGGAVTYQAITVQADAAQTGDRHSVGTVTTPAAAAPDTNGNVNLPPGVVLP